MEVTVKENGISVSIVDNDSSMNELIVLIQHCLLGSGYSRESIDKYIDVFGEIK